MGSGLMPTAELGILPAGVAAGERKLEAEGKCTLHPRMDAQVLCVCVEGGLV